MTDHVEVLRVGNEDCYFVRVGDLGGMQVASDLDAG